jgi:hypothetical protein
MLVTSPSDASGDRMEDSASAAHEPDTAPLSAIYMAIVWGVVTGKLSPAHCIDIFASQAPGTHPSQQPALASVLADVLWLAGVQVECGFGTALPAPADPATPAAPSAYQSTAEWKRLCSLLRLVFEKRL